MPTEAQRRAQLRAQRVLVQGRMVHPGAPHGSSAAYSDWGCKCPSCTAAQAGRRTARRRSLAAERVLVQGRMVHPRAPHGTTTGYQWYSCRCQSCTAALSALSARSVAPDPGAVRPDLAARLIELYVDRGLSIAATAGAVQLNRNTVSRQLRQLGVPLRRLGANAHPVPRPSASQLAHLRATMTQRELAEHYGVSPSTIHRWLAQLARAREHIAALATPHPIGGP